MRLSMDINRQKVFRLPIDIECERETHLDAIYNGLEETENETKRGKNDLFSAECQLAHCGAH